VTAGGVGALVAETTTFICCCEVGVASCVHSSQFFSCFVRFKMAEESNSVLIINVKKEPN